MADDNSSDRNYMLTTIDNPFDPFTQYEEWYAYDEKAGHHSTGLLARVCVLSPDLSEADQHVAVQNAIDEICHYNLSGVHRKVKAK